MKKFDVKSLVLGLIIGTVGITTVFAANRIKTANFSNATVTLGGVSVPLKISLVGIVKDNEKDMQLYMPVRELLEYLGYSVNWDEANNNIDLVTGMAKFTEIPEVPEIPTNKVLNGNEQQRSYYDNDSEIAKVSKNTLIDGFHRMGNDFKFSSFVGCASLYEFDVKEATELTIDFQSDITEGKFKLVLVTADSKVITVSETVTPDGVNIKNTFPLPKGKNTLKIVGLDACGNFSFKLSGDEALSYAKALSI